MFVSAPEIQELLAAVNSVAVKSSDKNTRTRALWVISKQAFPPEIVRKEVSSFTFLLLASFLTERNDLKKKKVSSFSFHFGSGGKFFVALHSAAFGSRSCFPSNLTAKY